MRLAVGGDRNEGEAQLSLPLFAASAEAPAGRPHVWVWLDDLALPALVVDANGTVIESNRAASACALSAAAVVDLRPGQDDDADPLVGRPLAAARLAIGPSRIVRQTVDPEFGHTVIQLESLGAAEVVLPDVLTPVAFIAEVDAHLAALAPAIGGRVASQAAPILVAVCDRWRATLQRLGPTEADDVGVELARRIRAEFGADCRIGRVGEGELGVLLPNPGRVDQMAERGRELASVLSRPVDLDERSVENIVGVGLVAHSVDIGARELIHRARLAGLRALEPRRGPVAALDRSMGTDFEERLRTERQMSAALAAGEFEVHLQPEYDLSSGELTAAESLARWNHPVFGLRSAGTFIEVAAATGQLVELGRWIIAEACRSAVALFAGSGGPMMRVNVSLPQLVDASIVDDVARVLGEVGLAPGRLCLEVTETSVVTAPDQVQATLFQLADLGVRLALDEFGSGPSVFGSLADLPFTRVNVSSRLVAMVDREPTAGAAVRALLDVAASIGAESVGVGVERPEQARWLAAHGCGSVQGFFVGRPQQPPAELPLSIDRERLGLI